MSGAINKAIEELKFTIPRPILERVFLVKANHYTRQAHSLEAMILNSVIRPRVLVDCNLVGGIQALIDLTDVSYETYDPGSYVYRIPKFKTNGKSIMSVLSLHYASVPQGYSYPIYGLAQPSNISAAGSALMGAAAAMPITSTARVSLIAENTVLINDAIAFSPNSAMRVILSNDENLSHIQPRSQLEFAKLCEFAVKSFIYNEYIITMDQGEIYAGYNLGAFKTIVESYADAEENYQTYRRTVWQRVAHMNDASSWENHLRSLVGGPR